MHRLKRQTAKHLDPKKLEFSIFTPDQIKNLSVTDICTPLSFNILGHPLKGGPYDPLLGPINQGDTRDHDPCGTCSENFITCNGHFGRINLPLPVVNPLFHEALFTLIKLSCLKCFTIQIPTQSKLFLISKIKLMHHGFYSDISLIEGEVRSALPPEQGNLNEAEAEYIKDVLNSYLTNIIKNGPRNDSIAENESEDASSDKENLSSERNITTNTRNINILYNSCLMDALKTRPVNKICISCQQPIAKLKTSKTRITMQRHEWREDDEVEEVDEDGKVYPKMRRHEIKKIPDVLLMADKAREYCRNIWNNEKDFVEVLMPCLSSSDMEHPTDLFFMEQVAVLPPSVRPMTKFEDQIMEHPQTQVYKSIVKDCLILKNIIQAINDGNTQNLPTEGRLVYEQTRGANAIEKLHYCWQLLQSNVNHLMDRDMTKTSDSSNCLGIKQLIEKKEGIIRMHMMGKRVNYAARSVITPDPNLAIDEIGVPEAFALKLTYPVPVTPFNVAELRNMVLNGPDVYPGAVLIETEEGFTRIHPTDPTKREAYAKRLLAEPKTSHQSARNKSHYLSQQSNVRLGGGKIVHRHLQNGDVLLLNRQPTLHRPSIMAFRARILKGEKTLRLHYANCNAFNADFDGDEMNAHLPQNELARSEAYNLATVCNQYLGPKDGAPLAGLIQDHVISGVKLTFRGNFFSRSDYMKLVFAGLDEKRGNLILLPPAILKPIPLWSGKQIVSTVIINTIPANKSKIHLTGKARIKPTEWGTAKSRSGRYFTGQVGGKHSGINQQWEEFMSESTVVIRNGILMSGVLDKNHYGATSFGLIHCVYELHGGMISSKMLSAFGKLFQAYLQLIGFTLGIEDIQVLPKKDQRRQKIIKACREVGPNIQQACLDMAESVTSVDIPAYDSNEIAEKMAAALAENEKFREQLDSKYKSTLDSFTEDINKTCLPKGLIKKFPDNNLQLMVQSGAKGSKVNTMQISCLLGQIELEGHRPPLMMSGKSLPSFRPFDPSPRAGGFVESRFATGLEPQEFFFHCMAGREGLIDTAVKTSRSGYLQRCLIKHLEGLMVAPDLTVRDSDQSVIQMFYGEDGLEVPNSTFFHKSHIPFLVDNKDAIVKEELVKELKKIVTEEEGKNIRKEIKKTNQMLEVARENREKEKEELDEDCMKKRSSPYLRFLDDFFKENPQMKTGKYNTIKKDSGRTKGAIESMLKWLNSSKKVKKQYNKKEPVPDPVSSRIRPDLGFGILPESLESLLASTEIAEVSRKELRELLYTKYIKGLCPAGESVGLLAAQSVGEPSTQMTLNTFHSAGRGEMNVTLGIPRLREILMMASKNIKTPSMEIPFRSTVNSNQINRLLRKLRCCTLSSILKNIEVEKKIVYKPQRLIEYNLKINLLPHKCYKHEFWTKPEEILEQIEVTFFKEMFKNIKKVAKKSGTLLHVRDEKKKSAKEEDAALDEKEETEKDVTIKQDIGEMHESSDEEELNVDADASAQKIVKKHTENQEYDSEDEQEVNEEMKKEDLMDQSKIKIDDEDDENDEFNLFKENNESRIDEDKDDDEDEDDAMDIDTKNGIIKINDQPQVSNVDNMSDYHRQSVVSRYIYGMEYDFDESKFEWCRFKFSLPLKMIGMQLTTILRETANRVVIHETPAIKKGFIFDNKGETILKTDGINIGEIFKFSKLLQLNRLYSNDIYAISLTYGIEAANRVIVKEVTEVFKAYGITVNPRHLSLIADYMTFDGNFQPLSRKGMEMSASPLQQMSFESSVQFLKNAVIKKKSDFLQSPSARLVVGRPCKTGTGSFDVFCKPFECSV